MKPQAFVSTFTPPLHLHSRPSKKPPFSPSTPTACTHSPSQRSPFSALAAGLASLSLLFRPIPVSAHPRQPHTVSQTSQNSNSTLHSTSSSILITPNENGISHQDSQPLNPPNGTLLRVKPAAARQNETSETTVSPPAQHNRNATSYPSSATTIPELAAAAGVSRAVSSDRLMRLRLRVRPAALGLVGVGALTSGSVLLRRNVKKGERTGLVDGAREDCAYCSVVFVQIPFCIPEREKLIGGLAELADRACLVNPDGMATAAKEAARLLLEESGLMEDSSKFAPFMDVFIAESITEAERRFSAHVEIEAQRIEKIVTKKCEKDVSSTAKLGSYGVVTLVIATTEGVDLGCYDCDATIMGRLRRALDSVSKLKTGEVAGMELLWVPEVLQDRSLTRAQLSSAFPSLRVL